MRIAGVHIERMILVIRDDKSGEVSCFKFDTLEKLFNSKEIKRCDEIYINAGENNFLVKTKFFPDKSPAQAKKYVLKHLSEFSVSRTGEYLIKVEAVPKDDGVNVYIIEGKEEQINNRIIGLPVDNYRISGVIPDNFAISYPFMFEKKLDAAFLIVEVGSEELILNFIDEGIITFSRRAFFEEKDLLDSLKKEIEVLLHRLGSVEKIYVTGKFKDKEIEKLKKEDPSYKGKIEEFDSSVDLSSDAILAYGLSLSPVIGFNNDLTPKYLEIGREKWKKEKRFRRLTHGIVYAMGALLSIPIILLIAGEIWLFLFNRQVDKLNNLYERNEKIKTEVIELKEKLKLHEESRTPIPWGAFLFEISDKIPDNVHLIELDSEPTIDENKKGFIFSLTGEGKSQEDVMSFYSGIQNIDMVGETNIKKIRNEEDITSFVFTVVLYSE